VYTVERWIRELQRPFDGGEHIVYVNGTWKAESEIGKLMHDFRCTEPDDMYYPALAK
jgi:hypothetical protein